MWGTLHSWINTIIYTAFICSVVLAITPSGRVRKAEEMICGIVMVFALVSIVKTIDIGAFAETTAKYRSEAEQYMQNGKDYSKTLNRTIIEDECEAYILDKAESLGAEISEIRVTASWSTEGFWYPTEISAKSECSEAQKTQLSQWIEAEFGIESEMQKWI